MKVLVLMCVLLTGCSTLGIAKTVLGLGGGGGPSLEIDTTVGDKEESVVRVGDEITAEKVTNIQELDYFLLLVALLGWMAPSPGEIWRGVLKMLPWSKK